MQFKAKQFLVLENIYKLICQVRNYFQKLHYDFFRTSPLLAKVPSFVWRLEKVI